MWWHAHSRWLRATVYGALIILPKLGSSYPFATPKQEFPVLLGEFLQNYLFNLPHISSHLTNRLLNELCCGFTGEWFDRDPNAILRQAQFTGGQPNVSVAYTVNSQPGDLYRCSSQGLPNKAYLNCLIIFS